MKFYKVLGKGGIACHGGSGKWHLPKNGEPGEWMPKIDDIDPCFRGYHLCREEDLLEWLNEEIYEAEGRGKTVRHENSKDVFQETRLLRRLDSWNEKTARLFAADCAEHTLFIFEQKYPKDDRPRKAIQAARDFANGKISSAAASAAWASSAAAWVAWDAARASSAAVWDAAGAAEKQWQLEWLHFYLYEYKEVEVS